MPNRLTPDELARIGRREQELLKGWSKICHPLKRKCGWTPTWMIFETGMEALTQEKADFVAIRRAIVPNIKEHPNDVLQTHWSYTLKGTQDAARSRSIGRLRADRK